MRTEEEESKRAEESKATDTENIGKLEDVDANVDKKQAVGLAKRMKDG